MPLILLAMVLGGCGKKPDHPAADFSKAPSISISLGKKNIESGLCQIHPKEGDNASPHKTVGQDCLLLQPDGDDAYIYFKIDPAFKKDLAMNLKVTVEYYDIERSQFWIEYDGWDAHDDKAGAHTKSVEQMRLTGNPTVWLKATFTLPKARLRNRQENGADFCIRVDRAHLFVHAVTVERVVEQKD